MKQKHYLNIQWRKRGYCKVTWCRIRRYLTSLLFPSLFTIVVKTVKIVLVFFGVLEEPVRKTGNWKQLEHNNLLWHNTGKWSVYISIHMETLDCLYIGPHGKTWLFIYPFTWNYLAVYISVHMDNNLAVCISVHMYYSTSTRRIFMIINIDYFSKARRENKSFFKIRK